MSVSTVKEYLAEFGFENRVQEFDVSSATVDLAAQALGVIPARIAKSLAFKVDDHAVLVVAAGDAKVDNAKFKASFHTKAKMLTADELVDLVGHAVGGVCPFALKDSVEVYFDISLMRFDTVYPAAGSSNSAVELTCDELATCAQNFKTWGDYCKAWQENE